MELIQLARALKEVDVDKDERRDIIENQNYYDEYSLYELYDALLDSEGEINIGSLSYYPSDVLKNVDPIAYQCGFSDFTIEYIEFAIDGETYYTDYQRCPVF